MNFIFTLQGLFTKTGPVPDIWYISVRARGIINQIKFSVAHYSYKNPRVQIQLWNSYAKCSISKNEYEIEDKDADWWSVQVQL